MKRIDGKVAIITGASSGIGRETAVLFAEEGAKIVAVGRNQERLAELAAQISPMTEVITVVAEALNPEDTKNVFARALEAFGTVDILVNYAGIADKHRPALKVTDEFWDEVIGVDLTSVFHYSREALEIMTKNGKGAIVNISSIGGVYANAGVAYSAAKAGEIAMTKNIALQYAGTNIRCNTVAPGPTPTELNTPEAIATFDTEFMEICGRHTDLSVGFSDVRDQANAILFLASDDARCITGQTLVVDRGMCL
jgi:NAD(P)-dependent dehydrogenase (short-subunit alcohol dehydrogenase family)